MSTFDLLPDVLSKIKSEKVEFMNLQFSDMMGMTKSVTIPAHKFNDAAKDGLWFDGSSVEGFTRIHESDMLLKPDLNTFTIMPWLKNDYGNIARVICDVHTPDGEPYNCDPRYILKQALKEAEGLGYEFMTGPELEFFLFKIVDGKILSASDRSILPHDRGQYFDLVLDLGFDVRRDMIYALEKMGIEVETSHHEVAEGQHEIDFKYGNALASADKVMTMKFALKAIAAKHGLHATFMPKPISGINGSGMHVHQSLFSLASGDNLFFDDSNKYKLSQLAFQFLAGQMEHVKAMSSILNPTVNSYKRLVPGYEAASYICWAQINRSALIRVPRYTEGKEKSTRIEIRNPDPSANPYLAFAVLLKAGLDGIKRKIQVPDAVEEDVFGFDDRMLQEKNIDTLPHSLWHSLEALKTNETIQNTLGSDFVAKYLRAKYKEWDRYRLHVTDWEIDQYLEVI